MQNTAAKTTRTQRQTAPQDRFAKILKCANELSESRLREMVGAYQSRWTPARRAEKAELIQSQKPWAYSTGPKTEAGKTRSSQNARSADYEEKMINRKMDAALRDHAHFLKSLLAAIRLAKVAPTLARPHLERLKQKGDDITRRLIEPLVLDGFFKTHPFLVIPANAGIPWDVSSIRISNHRDTEAQRSTKQKLCVFVPLWLKTMDRNVTMDSGFRRNDDERRMSAF